MGILLKWKKPTSESTYDQVRVYRSDSEDGTYTIIATQTIEDNSYYDYQGSGSSWYKIDFYDSINEYASNLSSAIQGNEHIGYCSVDEVRTMTNITAGQINDTALAVFIEMAAAQLNVDINVEHEDELIGYISSDKENAIDGTNLTFYTKNYPIGDKTNSYSVGTSDLEVYSIDGEGNKTTLTVTQVTAKTGQFKLNNAPENVDLYVTYVSPNIDVYTPHRMVKLACIWLTAAFAYSKINLGKAPRFRQGPLTVFRDTTAHDQYMRRYYEVLTKINNMVDMIEHEDAW